MLPLHVFWLPAPWERRGSKSGNELHAIIHATPPRRNDRRDDHVRSPRMESIARHVALSIWDLDQELAVRAIEFPWRLVDHVTFDAPDESRDLFPAAIKLTEQERERFIWMVGEFLKLGQRLYPE